MKRYLSSEFVGVGHPDKVADQVSDSILDLFLEKDKNAHVAVETLVSSNKMILAGEVKSNSDITGIDIKNEAIKTIEEIGYKPGIPNEFRSDSVHVQVYIKPQSSNIDEGVSKENGDIGAGDQGIMFGYATNQTSQYLPAAYVIAATLLNTLNDKIRKGELTGLYTDNKSQVCCLYDNGNIFVEKVILSCAHDLDMRVDEVRKLLYDEIIVPVLKTFDQYKDRTKDVELFINSAGPFWQFGPSADCGLTGRKIIVDTYGGFAPHGGGAFSGKDPSKVDRSAAYMARHIAKSIVANGYAKEALVQLSYAIGQVRPFSVAVKSENPTLPEEILVKMIEETFDLSPKGIIDYLKLTDSSLIKYKKIASGGHFLNPDVTWEQIKKF